MQEPDKVESIVNQTQASDQPEVVETEKKPEHHHKKEDHKHLEKEVKDLREQNGKLAADAAQFKDAYARKVAEFDNYKKRVLREMDDLRVTANRKLVLEFIPVYDNLRRALESSTSQEHYQALYDGLRIIFDQMKSMLEKENVKPIESKGAPFDHTCHEALMMEEREDVEHEMTVIEEFEKGYTMGGMVIKPAKVKVGKKKAQ